jgi:hypothetical protein
MGEYTLTAGPTCDVQLLKQSSAMDIIKAHMRKSVGATSAPDIRL